MAFGLTAVAGLEVGHFTDPRRPTGCTVVIAREGAVAGVDVRGDSPGTRETELLDPVNAIEKVHAVVLAGGSAFGLDAAAGAMRWLEERGIGATIGAPADGVAAPFVVPIVPAAILFDLSVGDARIRPDAACGYAACEAATRTAPAEGNVGAGAGTASIAGCGARAARGSVRTGSWSGSSAWRRTSRWPRKRSSSFAGRSRSRPASWRRANRGSGPCSTRCWRCCAC